MISIKDRLFLLFSNFYFSIYFFLVVGAIGLTHGFDIEDILTILILIVLGLIPIFIVVMKVDNPEKIFKKVFKIFGIVVSLMLASWGLIMLFYQYFGGGGVNYLPLIISISIIPWLIVSSILVFLDSLYLNSSPENKKKSRIVFSIVFILSLLVLIVLGSVSISSCGVAFGGKNVECLADKAIENSNPEVCVGEFRCISSYAASTGDYESCDSLDNEETIRRCKVELINKLDEECIQVSDGAVSVDSVLVEPYCNEIARSGKSYGITYSCIDSYEYRVLANTTNCNIFEGKGKDRMSTSLGCSKGVCGELNWYTIKDSSAVKIGDNVEFSITTYDTIQNNEEVRFLWFVDSDNSPKTGQLVNSLGSDYNVRVVLKDGDSNAFIDKVGSSSESIDSFSVSNNIVRVAVPLSTIGASEDFKFSTSVAIDNKRVSLFPSGPNLVLE